MAVYSETVLHVWFFGVLVLLAVPHCAGGLLVRTHYAATVLPISPTACSPYPTTDYRHACPSVCWAGSRSSCCCCCLLPLVVWITFLDVWFRGCLDGPPGRGYLFTTGAPRAAHHTTFPLWFSTACGSRFWSGRLFPFPAWSAGCSRSLVLTVSG